MRQIRQCSCGIRFRHPLLAALVALTAVVAAPMRSSAQGTGTVVGLIVEANTRKAVASARVEVEGMRFRTVTDREGRFRLVDVPEGKRTLIVSSMSTGAQRVPIDVPSSGTMEVRIEVRSNPLALSEIRVTAGSRVPQWVVQAPVAIAVVDRVEARNYATTGQLPQVIKGLPGMDVSANGIHDFNVNARGFNSDLAQRMLLLMDGRDLAIPFLAAQEWSALSLPIDDFERIEVARGPSAALYGANAYNGVINLISPAPRDATGSKVSLSGGELGTLRADIRHARVFGREARFGVRANLGLSRSDDWHLSRTNLGDFAREYARRVDTTAFPVNTPAPGFEVLPLNGQRITGLPGAASGTPDPVESVYGSTRLDYYRANGAIGTLEGGAARATNQLFMTNVGRFQVDHAWRPWVRAAWNDHRYYVTGWYSGRSSQQHSMASGSPIEEKSSLLHVESQWNGTARNERLKFVLGGSYRRSLVDSRGTLVAPADDARNDWSAGAFGQLKYELTPALSLVVAGRSDGSNLYDAQFSPKAALVYSPAPTQSLRVSAGRGFQTPRMTNFFLHVPLGLPADLTALEGGMRAAFGSALSSVPQGALFTSSAAVPALALGNPALDVEHVISYEVGYRREVDRRINITIDGYYSVVRDFVSALLPYANSAFGRWTAPASVSASARGALESAVQGALGPGSGLTRLSDPAGTTAIVYSYGNAGRATEWGTELGAGVVLSRQIRVEANYSYFGYRVDEGVPLVPGDLIAPNTPKHKGNVRASFTASGFDAWGGANFTAAHDWSSGFFQGRIPSSERVDAGVGYLLRPGVRVHAIATNLLDQRRYHIYGGSIDRRRVLAGVTGTF